MESVAPNDSVQVLLNAAKLRILPDGGLLAVANSNWAVAGDGAASVEAAEAVKGRFKPLPIRAMIISAARIRALLENNFDIRNLLSYHITTTSTPFCQPPLTNDFSYVKYAH